MTDIHHEDVRKTLEGTLRSLAALQERAGITIDLTEDDPAAALGASIKDVEAVVVELADRAEQEAWARASIETELRRYRQLFELAPVAYLVTDGDGVIVAANQFAAAVLNMRPDHLTGKSIGTFVAYRERQPLLPELDEALHAEVCRWALPIRPWGQPPRVMSVDVGRTLDDDGNVSSLRWLLHDRPAASGVTFRQDITRFRTEEEDDDTSVLSGTTDDAGTEPDQMRKITRRLAISTQRLDTVLHDLSDIAHTPGRSVNRAQRVNVGLLVREVVAKVAAPEDRYRLNVQDVVAVADPNKIDYIVEQLLGNAFARAPLGSLVWIRVRALGGSVLVAVEDSGARIPDELKVGMFRPTQLPTTGSGLGFVARIAELVGGHAWVQDRPSGGASFRVLIPGATGSEPTSR